MPSPFPYIWYKFDTISSSKVINSGSAGATLDATLYNGASVINNENANPIGSTCLNLQNTPNKLCSDSTGQYLSIPPFTLGGPFSFSCWFKKDNKNQEWARIFNFSLAPPSEKLLTLAFASKSGYILIAKNDSNSSTDHYVNQTNYCDQNWHHIAIVSDASNITFYIDNVKCWTSAITALENVQRVNNYIGRSSNTNDVYATMQIDDFRLYTTPLTESDIATLFTYRKTITTPSPAISSMSTSSITTSSATSSTTSLVTTSSTTSFASAVPYIWYKFDTLSSSKVINSGSAGASLDATLNNDASVINNESPNISPVGSTCLNLKTFPSKESSDTTGQYLSIPPFTLGGLFSCSCWFKKDTKYAYEEHAKIFDFSNNTNNDAPLSLEFYNTNGNISLNYSTQKIYSNDTNYCDNKWHHIVVVSDGSMFLIYIDNVQVKTFKYKKFNDIHPNNNYLGRSWTNKHPYSTMQIDDFRLYTTPLTASDIATLFTYKKPSTVSSFALDQTTIGILIAIVVIVIMIIIYIFS